eukprot:m.43789 g.43789  ORF g.43789 m.43789 type:complete len:295 (-) comp10009_c0_seq2:2304-3188(-)
MDFVASFPLEILTVAGVFTENRLRIACILRANRVVRVYKVFMYFNFLQRWQTRNTGRTGLLKFLLMCLLLTHLSACFWFIIGCFPSCPAARQGDNHTIHTWTLIDPPGGGYRPVALETRAQQYLASVYWATATMVSVGYGDFHAISHLEMLFACLVMLLGTILYGYFIASIAASIANADTLRSRFAEKLDCLLHFFRRSRVDEEVAVRVREHFEYLWHRNQGIHAHVLFKDFPLSLQADLCVEIIVSRQRRRVCAIAVSCHAPFIPFERRVHRTKGGHWPGNVFHPQRCYRSSI